LGDFLLVGNKNFTLAPGTAIHGVSMAGWVSSVLGGQPGFKFQSAGVDTAGLSATSWYALQVLVWQ